MFGVDTTEFIIVAVAALLFIGPKDLPGAMRTLGQFIGKVRGMARHFNTGLEAMIREAELEELERQWREENERIMREYPAIGAQVSAEGYDEDQPPLPLAPPGDVPAPSPEPASSSSAGAPPEERRELP